MKKNQTYIASLLFSSLLMLPLLAIVLLQLWQSHIQREVLEQMEFAMLETVIIDKEDLEWERFNKEVRVGGKLFDVKSIKSKGNQLVLTGLFDEKETAIKDILKRQASQSGNSLLQLLAISQCFGSIETFHVGPSPFTDLKRIFKPFISTFSDCYKENVFSPPKRLSFT